MDRYLAVDVRRWAREGLLRPGLSFRWRWTLDGREVAAVNVTVLHDRLIFAHAADGGVGTPLVDARYVVPLTRTPCHFGGHRAWFACPVHGCGRRVAILYGGPAFACRHCHRLAYPSQRQPACVRAILQAQKIRTRPGWLPGIRSGTGPRPKGMHRVTFGRLSDRYRELVARYLAELRKVLDREASAGAPR